MSYDHQKIEKKWQKYWEEKKLFETSKNKKKPKYYILDMFPYPSGSGLHVGHVAGYAATDVIARYKRQKGFNVLHPIGWDSFGLPAEQYAIRTGTHPAVTTQKNINTYKKQLKSLGLSYNWDREFATSDPNYYKWTQWLFTKLYDRGLVYEAEIPVNYCPSLGTVLANEEVENGKSKEGGYPVERRPLKQWMMRITAYADQLLEGLQNLDWPEHLKRLQVNWIGKSEGAQITFKVKNTQDIITVFTTRPETLFGVTFLSLAPESPLVLKLVSEEQRQNVSDYLKIAQSKSDLERTDLAESVSGVFLGAYVQHPLTNKEIPIWVADYVLPHYGTGAVMGVPGHDSRDFRFAKTFQISKKNVIRPILKNTEEESAVNMKGIVEGDIVWEGEGVLCNAPPPYEELNGVSILQGKNKIVSLLKKEGQGKLTTVYKLRDWLFSRQRYWGEPFPILHFADGSKRVLDLDELPLCPPELTDFRPKEDGQSPLSKAVDWVHIFDKKTQQRAQRELNTMPQWAGSCWYYLRFCDPKNKEQAWSEEEEKYWMPVDLYVGGVEHAVLHLLYARFWHKVFFDCGLVSTEEPFQALRNQGLVVAKSYKKSQGGYVAPSDVEEQNGSFFDKVSRESLTVATEKMSKSKLNGVVPDEMVQEHGADALRLYELFMGPFDKEKVWNTEAMMGCCRFLQRFYQIILSSEKLVHESSLEALQLGHRLIAAVTEDIESLNFNTAIAKFMEFLNAFSKLPQYSIPVIKMVVQALSPFAPHLMEEMWEILGGTSSLMYEPFPVADPCYLVSKDVTYVVQVNGKLRARLHVNRETTQKEIEEIAKKESLVKKHIEKMHIIKIIFVPEKLINFVVK